MTLQELQAKIGEWHRGAFPDATIEEVLDKCDEELNELRSELEFVEFKPDRMREIVIAEEMADLQIALLALSAKYGIDLAAAVDEKHAVNLTREWRRDDAGRWKRCAVRKEMRDGQ